MLHIFKSNNCAMNENRIKNKQCYVGHCGHPTLSSIECVIYTLILHPGPKLHMHYNLKQISNPGKTYEEVSNGQSPLCCIIYLHFLTGVAIWTGVTRSDSHSALSESPIPSGPPILERIWYAESFQSGKGKHFLMMEITPSGDVATVRSSLVPPPPMLFFFVCFFLFVIFLFSILFFKLFLPPA